MDQKTVKRAIMDLLGEGVLTWVALESLVYELSRQGWDRARVVGLCTALAHEGAESLDAASLDFIGDFTLHLIGQCNARHIVRLAGDPENTSELAELVCSGAWRRPAPEQEQSGK